MYFCAAEVFLSVIGFWFVVGIFLSVKELFHLSYSGLHSYNALARG